MKSIIKISLLLILSISAMGQIPDQTIRGSVLDIDNDMPLIGVNILLIGETTTGTSTDVDGTFRLENIPIGRVDLQVSYLGYEEKLIPNIVVNSAKEVVLTIRLLESTLKIDEVQITAYQDKNAAINEMSLLSSRSISPEETNRYAGGFNDPSKIVNNFAGVNNTQDGGNDIIIRGNSPKYMQWRLEDLQITSPSHFGDQSSLGGSISTLNNNMLDRSDFYTGAFSAEYGNVLSGIYDVRLRPGNNEKYEAVFGFGLLGTDLTFEGPIKKGYKGSFIVNYRYSTAGIIKDLGLLGDINGVPTFQDASFKVVLPSKKLGTFSFFGLGGKSDFLFEDVKPATWVTPGNNFQKPEIVEDFNKNAHLLNLGLNHTISISDNSYLKTGILFSTDRIEDEIFENEYELVDGLPDLEKLIENRLNFNNLIDKDAFRCNIAYHHKLNAKHKLEIGSKYDIQRLNANQSMLSLESKNRNSLLDLDEKIAITRNYINWNYRINDRLTFVQGIHNINVAYNDKRRIENRSALRWKMDESWTINAGFGNHSTMESVHHYFTKIEDENGIMQEVNADLDLLKSNHFVLGIEKKINKNINIKAEAYYQHLFDIPVANDINNTFSTLNESLDFQYIDLVNEGSGKNYGVEFTLERSFSNNYYYLANLSLYESKFTALDGIERNTRFNGNYIANILFGKEFPKLGKKDNQTLGLNVKAFISGGKPTAPLYRDDNKNLLVNPDVNKFYDNSKSFDYTLDDLYQINVSASYKWNKKKTTSELFINLENVSNYRGKISEYYDVSEEGSIGYMTQFGFFPNLMYRLYF